MFKPKYKNIAFYFLLYLSFSFLLSADSVKFDLDSQFLAPSTYMQKDAETEEWLLGIDQEWVDKIRGSKSSKSSVHPFTTYFGEDSDYQITKRDGDIRDVIDSVIIQMDLMRKKIKRILVVKDGSGAKKQNYLMIVFDKHNNVKYYEVKLNKKPYRFEKDEIRALIKLSGLGFTPEFFGIWNINGFWVYVEKFIRGPLAIDYFQSVSQEKKMDAIYDVVYQLMLMRENLFRSNAGKKMFSVDLNAKGFILDQETGKMRNIDIGKLAALGPSDILRRLNTLVGATDERRQMMFGALVDALDETGEGGIKFLKHIYQKGLNGTKLKDAVLKESLGWFLADYDKILEHFEEHLDLAA